MQRLAAHDVQNPWELVSHHTETHKNVGTTNHPVFDTPKMEVYQPICTVNQRNLQQ